MQLTFLGTGGGRFCMTRQIRQTGGFVVETEECSVLVDPGPGALIYGLRNDVAFREIDAVFVSHNHLDHTGDLEVVIEAMTNGCTEERGALITNEAVVSGDETYDPAVSVYHRESVERCEIVSPGEEIAINGAAISFTETRHKDIQTTGFVLEAGDTTIGYIPDTEYFGELAALYEGSDILIVNAPRPHDREWEGHMNLQDAVAVVEQVEPEKAFIQHFGLRFVYQFREEKQWLSEQETDTDIVLPADNATHSMDGALEQFL